MTEPSSRQKPSLPTPVALFKEAFFLCKERLRPILSIILIALLLCLPFTILYILLGYAVHSLLIPRIWNSVVFLLSYIAFLFAVTLPIYELSLKEIYQRGKVHFLSILCIGVLYLFVVLGGTYFLTVPGILFLIWFLFAPFVLVQEGRKGWNALFQSKEYVKGYWGNVFWRLIALGLASFFVYLIYYGIVSLGFKWAESHQTSLFNSMPTRYFIQLIANILTDFLTAPLIFSYLFLIYKHLRKIKGDVVAQPTSGQRTLFIIIAVIGVIGGMIPLLQIVRI